MWAEGSIKIENSIFHYWVKHYEEPSEDYGIDGGRISKLMLKRNGEIAYDYDRGPDIEPVDRETEMALAIPDCRQTWCWVLCPVPFFFKF